MKSFLFIALIVLIKWTAAQEVLVVDSETGTPVDGVIISAGRQSVLTNNSGKAQLDVFSGKEILHFRHPSYDELRLDKGRIASGHYVVRLTEKPLRLDEIVVSVSRRPENRSEVPNRIRRTGENEVILSQIQNTARLAEAGGEVFIQESQQGGGSPMIRGFSANRLLLVVDGIRMNNAIFRSGNLHNVVSIDPNMVESAEIIPGPGTVVYGSDALGGVMGFNTFRPKLSTGDQWNTEHYFRSGYSTGNQSAVFHGRVGFGRARWGITAAATYSRFGDLTMGRHGPSEYLRPEFVVPGLFNGKDSIIRSNNSRKQVYTGYSQLNLMGKVRFVPSSRLSFLFSAHHSATGDVPRYDRLIVYKNNRLRYGDWYYGPQKWTLISAQSDWMAASLFFDRASLIAGYQYFEESRHDRYLHSPDLFNRKESLDAYTLTLDFTKEPVKNLLLMYGYEWMSNNVGSSGNSENLITGRISGASSRYPDGSLYSSNAVYFAVKVNAGDGVVFNSGIRWTETRMEGTFDQRFFDFPFSEFRSRNDALNGNIGVIYRSGNAWQASAVGSSGFRSPNLDDVAKVFDSEPGNLIVPNPDLRPEFAYNLEGNLTRKLPGEGSLELSLFRTWLRDAMVRRPVLFNGMDSLVYNGVLSKIESLVNADHAGIYGVSILGDIPLSEHVRFKSGISWLKGRDSDGNSLRHIPPVFGVVKLDYSPPGFTVEINTRFNGSIPYGRLAPEERDKPYLYASDSDGNPWSPSWWTLNTSTRWNVTGRTILSLGVANILGKRYRPYSSGIAAAGRSFSVSLSLSL